MSTSILKAPFTRDEMRVLCAFASAHLLGADVAALSLAAPAKELQDLWPKAETLLNGAIDKQIGRAHV